MSSTVRPWRLWTCRSLLPKSAAVVGRSSGLLSIACSTGGADIVRYLSQVPCRGRLSGYPQELGDDPLIAAAFEGGVTGEGTKQGRAQAVHVGRGSWAAAEKDLGCRERRRCVDYARRGFEAAGYPCDTEIGQLGFAVLGEQDVRGFDVTVQGAQPMCGLQGSGDLHPDVQRLHPGERADGMDACAQGVARMVLHHDEGPARRRRADIKNVDDVRMPAQLAHRALLAQKPLDVVGIEVRGEHLHRDGALQRTLLAAVDRSEATDADLSGIVEPGGSELRGDRRRQVTPAGRRFAFGHQPPRPRYSSPAIADPCKHPSKESVEHNR